MEQSNFTFSGDWEFTLNTPDFFGYFANERKDTHNSIMKLRVEIQDELNENPDPSPEQLSTLDYFLENQELIAAQSCQKVLAEMPQIISLYNLENEKEYQNLSMVDIKSLIEISSLYIHPDTKEGFAYYDLTGNCKWDEEHGLSILFWKDKPIWMGQIDGSSGWEALKDNGTYDEVLEKQKNVVLEKPKLFESHPKYGKLKPSQRFANEYYPSNLLRQNLYNEFIDHINQSNYDQSKLQELFRQSLQENRAVIIEFLMPKVNPSGLIHWFHKSQNIIDFLLENGVSINETDHYEKNILAKAMFDLRYQLTTLAENKLRNPDTEPSKDNIEKSKQFILWLVSKGADVNHKSIESAYAFSSSQYDSNALIEEMKDVLRPFQAASQSAKANEQSNWFIRLLGKR